jgi:transposase-like protein
MSVFLVVVGVDEVGYRETLDDAESTKEDKASWRNFLRFLKERAYLIPLCNFIW